MAQLVLQFATTEGLDSYDKLIRFEKTLISVLGKSAEVDGHDFGSSEINIFILTEDPLATFALIQQTDLLARPGEKMKVAYRPLDGQDYVCLWPPELRHFQIT
jgi:hypothetical protein